jgi:outer membrane protein TolC
LIPALPLFFFIAPLAGFALASAQDAPLSLPFAQQRAIEVSRQLDAKRHGADAALDLAAAAERLPDPVLKLSVDNVPTSGPDRYSLNRDFMTQRTVGLMQELTRAEKRRLRAERLASEATLARAEQQQIKAELQRDVAIAWLERYYAEATARVIGDQIKLAELEFQAAESAYRTGRGTQAELLDARTLLVLLRDRASELERQVRNTRLGLARWTRLAPDVPLGDKPATDQIPLAHASLDAQLLHHPELHVLARQGETAQKEVELARAEKKADWTVELAYHQRGPGYPGMVSLGVSVPLQWQQKHRQDREVAAKLAALEQVKAEREELLRAHQAETHQKINAWENTRERHARYLKELLPLAEGRTAAQLAAYRGGKAGLSAVLAARRAETEVRLQALELEASAARQWAELNFLLPREPGAMNTDANQ